MKFLAKQGDDGKPRLDDQARYERHCAAAFHPGQRLELIIRPERGQRSADQLGYWFGVPMEALASVTGYTKMQCHALCLSMRFGFTVDPATGREVPAVPVSRGLTREQFGQLIDWFPRWAHQTYGLVVRLPHEVDVDDLPSTAAELEVREGYHRG